MSAIPASVLATFPKPNYVNPETRAPAYEGVAIPLTALGFLFVVARFYTRHFIKHNLGWDDWAMAFATCCSIAMLVVECVSIRYGFGLHIWDVRAANVTTISQLALAFQLTFVFATSWPKISACMSYLRLFPSRDNVVFCYVMIAYNVGYCISIFFAGLFQCTPISDYWELFKPTRHCVNTEALLLSTAVFNVLSDLLVFLWPARFLMQLQMPMKERLGLTFLTCVGCIVCAAGLIRIKLIKDFVHSYDSYWGGVLVIMLASIEINVSIICGSLPALRPLWTKLYNRYFPSQASSNPSSWRQSSKAIENPRVRRANHRRRSHPLELTSLRDTTGFRTIDEEEEEGSSVGGRLEQQHTRSVSGKSGKSDGESARGHAGLARSKASSSSMEDIVGERRVRCVMNESVKIR